MVEIKRRPPRHQTAICPTLQGQAFDLVFLDADKASNPDYFTWALKLSRVGSVIIVDNVVRGGAVADSASTDPSIIGIRRMNDDHRRRTAAWRRPRSRRWDRRVTTAC